MIKCIIFDLDGTLVDTLKDLAVTSNEILVEYGYKEIEINKYRQFIGNGIKKLVERAIVYSSGDMSYQNEMFDKFICNYQKNYLRFAEIYEGIIELLNILKEKGYLLFVNTNKNDDISKKMINSLLPNYFINVYGDSLNYPRKPDPYIINKIKKEYCLSNDEIIMVGDSDIDVITAHNAEIKAVGCIYGFRGLDELKNVNCDYLINKPLELLKILNI